MSQTTKAGHPAVSTLVAAMLGMTGSCILFAAYLTIPVIGIVSGIVAPFPVLLVRLRIGRAAAFSCIVGATVGLAAYFGSTTALLYLIQCGLVALLMSELVLKGIAASRAMVWTTALNMMLIALALVYMSLAGTFDFHSTAVAEIKKSVSQATVLYEQAGIKGEELDMVKKTMSTAADLVIRLYPALITLTYLLMAGCNILLLKRFAAKTGYNLKIGELKDFRAPELLIWLFIVAGFSLLASSPVITTPALNLLAILAVMYFMQGWGVVLTIVGRQAMAGMLRVCITIVLLVQPYMAALITILGIFDLWGDFRTQKQQENL